MSPAPTGDLRTQVGRIRTSVALSMHASLSILQFEASDGISVLDPLIATGLDIREAQFRQALHLDDAGQPIADLFVGFFRGTLHLLGPRLPPPTIIEALEASGAVAAHEDHVVVGLDGPFAWELLAAWDTDSAVGLPFLGAYTPRDDVLVIRTGQTGEYGYRIVVRKDQVDGVWEELLQAAGSLQGGVVGPEALAHCAFENWVFDPERHPHAGLDALELQLTWRLDLHKQAVGLDAIRAHRDAGLRRRITAIRTVEPVAIGAEVVSGDRTVGRVLGTAPDLFGADHRVVAVLDMPWAHAGMEYAIEGRAAHTVSAPFVLNRSLFVNPQRHSWATRDEVELPEGSAWPDTTSS